MEVHETAIETLKRNDILNPEKLTDSPLNTFTMSDKPMNQFLPADVFLKSAVVEKNPDMSFREVVAEYFGVSPEEVTRIRRTKDASGWNITIQSMYEPSTGDEDYQWDLGPEEYWDEEDAEESEWMTPEDMGIAQKMDWSDDEGNEISDEQKLEYFKSRDDMYEVDEENGLVRLRPEEDWFPEDNEEGLHEYQVVYDEKAGLVTIYLDGKMQGEQELLGDYPETEIWKALMEYFPEEDKDELQAIADEAYYNGSHTWYA